MYSVTGMIFPTALICYGVLHILNDKGGISYIYCAIGFTHEAWGFATYIRDAIHLVNQTISYKEAMSYGIYQPSLTAGLNHIYINYNTIFGNSNVATILEMLFI